MATIREVAKYAGVAPITVSRVINKSSHVSAEVRQRVEKAISELNYIPTSLGPSLRSKKTHILALILPDITNPFWTTVARGIEDVCNEHGYSVVFCNTDESRSKLEQYVNVMLRKQIDGFFYVPVNTSTDTLRKIQKHGTPVVVLDRTVSGGKVDMVRCDSEDGAYHITRHLIEQGHRNIAIFTGPADISTARDRVAGYRRALAVGGIPAIEQNIYWGDFGHDSGYNGAKEALQTEPYPTGLVAGNNFIAIGVIHALDELGISVPDDVAMVSFDEFPLGLTISPFFTSVFQPAYQMGFQAAELLLSRISEGNNLPYQEIILPIQVVFRQSSQKAIPQLP